MPQPVLEDTKDRILDAAGRVFAEKGFREATVRDICQSAQVNIAAVNYHFGDKERLYIESVKFAHGTVIQGMAAPSWPADMPAGVQTRPLILMLVSRLLDEPRPSWHSRLVMRAMAEPSAACFEIV